MRKYLLSLFSIILILGVSYSNALALSVGYINAGGGSVNYLTSYGHTVSYLNNPTGLTLTGLSGFDVVMLASNSTFTENANIGNVVGDFADAGGGVVLTQFVFQGNWALTGKIMDTGYSPFVKDPLSSDYNHPNYFGTIYDSMHPIFDGVNTSNFNGNYQANVSMDTGAVLVADWTTGRHAIGYNTLTNSSVVGINTFPPNVFNADTKRLMANAINYSLTTGSPVPEPTTMLLLGTGLIGLVGARRRMKK